MVFSPETAKLLALVRETVAEHTSLEEAFQLNLRSFLQTCSEKNVEKNVHVIARSSVQKLMEDLKVEEQYHHDIAMQMKRLGPVRGNKEKSFMETTVKVGWIEKKAQAVLFYEDAWGNEHEVPDKRTYLNKFFPEWVEVVGGVDFLNTKKKQGFTQVNLLCTGIELARLGELNESVIIDAYNAMKLSYPRNTFIASHIDRGTHMTEGLYYKKVCYFFDEYTEDNKNNECGTGLINVDVRGDLLFYPKNFDHSAHGGMIFEEYVRKTEAIQCILTIPESNLKQDFDFSVTNVGGRVRHQTGKTAYAYLVETRDDDQYKGESWMTLHELLTSQASIVRRYGVVMNGDTGVLALGSFLKNNWSVSFIYWNKYLRQLHVDCCLPEDIKKNFGVRTSVKRILC